MVKLLIIADDFTGALDTGIQFKKRGSVHRFSQKQSWRIVKSDQTQRFL